MTLQTWLRPNPDTLFPEALPPDALFLGEAPEVVALCRHGDAPEAQWTRADVFTSEWNLRVRRLGNAVRAVAAGPVPGITQFGEAGREVSLQKAGEDPELAPRHIMLWGRRNAGEAQWIELRVPHLMDPESDLHPEGHGAEHTGQMVRRRLVVVPHEVSSGDTDPSQSGEPSRVDGLSQSGEPFWRYAGLSYAETDSDDTFLEPVSEPIFD